jgi:signal transduction histidine kinase
MNKGASRTVHVTPVETNGRSSGRLYVGHTPVRNTSGVIGFGEIVVAAGSQAVFRGESPAVVRGESQERLESFYRPITVAEFRGGRLVSSTSTILPVGYKLPTPVAERLAATDVGSTWFEQTLGDQSYETFYIERPWQPNEVIGLGLPALGLLWHVVGVIKVLVYYAIVVSCIVIVLFLTAWVRGYRHEFSFRDRLLAAFLLATLVPLALLATYSRIIVRERLMENTSRRLQQETTTIAVSIVQRLRGEEGSVQTALDKEGLLQLAVEAGTDFSLYVGTALHASSRPELYSVGLLDPRISGPAYSSVILKGNRFFMNTERIGTYQYAVGYRPLVDEGDRITGIVAVPTLYRMDELEVELARRNALIFGVYAVVFFLMVILATVMANRIAEPIHRLTLATKRVARGDLDVVVGGGRSDGEVGELIRSFEQMTRELKQSRHELVNAERELAWKEMAKQVAHEIKNPLTPMKLSIQHLQHVYKERVADFDRHFHEITRTLVDQIEALSRIAGEFSRFARMPKQSIVRLDVNEVLLQSVQLFEQDKGIRFDVRLADTPLIIQGDREELRRGFINILRNGIQAMNSAGTITVRTQAYDGNAVVSIQDRGPGIPDDVKPKLFQPNFSTKTDGMGLGLAITKKSIDDIGGTISIQSTVGTGTTVTIAVPLVGNTSETGRA